MKTNSDTPPALYIGLDVHKEQTTVAIADPDCRSAPRLHGNVRTTQHALEAVLRRIAKAHECPIQDLEVCYEAGGCGMWIARRLLQLKVRCMVVAPSLIPKQPGEKVKTDKKDAKKLARLLRAGELTAVRVPDEVDEALRDLCRGRVDAVDDLRRAKTRLLAMLRRLGFNYQGRNGHWTEEHKSYLRSLTLPLPAHRFVMEELMGQIDQLLERVARLEKKMFELLEEWEWEPVVKALMAFKGLKEVAAMITISELGDLTRFKHPRQLMGFLGLVPSEDTTATRRREGAITKCGNSHARWLLIESAQAYRSSPKVSAGLSKRQDGQSQKVRELSWRAQNRLRSRYRRLKARGKRENKVIVAVARELCAFVWELHQLMRDRLPASNQTQPTP